MESLSKAYDVNKSLLDHFDRNTVILRNVHFPDVRNQNVRVLSLERLAAASAVESDHFAQKLQNFMNLDHASAPKNTNTHMYAYLLYISQ